MCALFLLKKEKKHLGTSRVRRRHTLVPSQVLPQPRLLTQDERNEQGAQTANVLSPSAISQDPANPQQGISYASLWPQVGVSILWVREQSSVAMDSLQQTHRPVD